MDRYEHTADAGSEPSRGYASVGVTMFSYFLLNSERYDSGESTVC